MTLKRHPHQRFALLVAALIGCCAVTASAQSYPAKTVRVVVPFAPGGGIDLMARIISHAANVSLAKVEKLSADGAQPVGGTPVPFADHIKNEISKWANVVKYARMRVD